MSRFITLLSCQLCLYVILYFIFNFFKGRIRNLLLSCESNLHIWVQIMRCLWYNSYFTRFRNLSAYVCLVDQTTKCRMHTLVFLLMREKREIKDSDGLNTLYVTLLWELQFFTYVIPSWLHFFAKGRVFFIIV